MALISSLRDPSFGSGVQSPGINPRVPIPGGVPPQAFRGGPSTGINPQLPGINQQGPTFGINQPPGGASLPTGKTGPTFGHPPPPIPTGGIVPPNFQTGGIRTEPGTVPNDGLTPPGQFGSTPQFGLSGAEAAFQGGALAGSSAIQTGVQQGLGTLLGGFNEAQAQRGQALGVLGGDFSTQAQGFNAQNANAAQINRQAGQGLFGQASQGVNQFTGAGLQAQQQAAALSGTQGQAAFDQARLNNPAIDFLNQRGQTALINASAATGGLGSGQFKTELQQLGQAQAQQDIQRQIQNAQALSQQGLQAAGQSGQFLAQGGQQLGQLEQAQGQFTQQTNLANQAAQNRAAEFGAAAQNQAGLFNAGNRLQAAQGQANIFGQGAQQAGQLSQAGAQFQVGGGRDIANLLAGAAGQIGGTRFQAGQDIANQVTRTTSGLSGLQNLQGSALSDLLGSFAANQGNLLTGAGGAASGSQAQLAALLANLATQQGTTAGNLALQGGQTGATAALASGANQQQLLGNLLAASQLEDS